MCGLSLSKSKKFRKFEHHWQKRVGNEKPGERKVDSKFSGRTLLQIVAVKMRFLRFPRFHKGLRARYCALSACFLFQL